jgi:hypothetical protein
MEPEVIPDAMDQRVIPDAMEHRAPQVLLDQWVFLDVTVKMAVTEDLAR